MVKFEVTYGSKKAYISINTNNAEKPVLHQYSGSAKELLIDDLEDCYGLYGHSIGMSSPAIDMQHALFHSQNKKFVAKVLEGADVLANWKAPKLPKNVKL